jgi:hypothetical protein
MKDPGKTLESSLGKWGRKGSTSGPTPWLPEDDDDDDNSIVIMSITVHNQKLFLTMSLYRCLFAILKITQIKILFLNEIQAYN